nr:MAG TPA_asm: hypothetical protein [Caudoviricetes sp.]
MTISTSRQYKKQKIKENIYVYLNHVVKDMNSHIVNQFLHPLVL